MTNLNTEILIRNGLGLTDEEQERYEKIEKPIDDLKREIFGFKDIHRMSELERIEYLLVRIYHLLYEKKQKTSRKLEVVLTTEQVMEKYSIARSTTMEIFASKGSPAFKIGAGRGHWRVNEEDFKKFLIKQSEGFKG